MPTGPVPKILFRLPFVAVGLVSFICGVWGGLIRLPIPLPFPTDNPNWIIYHGPLMVCGFLGTVIALERAVGLPGRWPYIAPLLTGVGAVLLLSGNGQSFGVVLFMAGSAAFVMVTVRVIQLQRALFTTVMSLGAVAWLVGNIFWIYGWPLNRVVLWWIVFLGLTIVGERLDLSRFQRQVPASRPLFFVALAIFVGGALLSCAMQKPGERVLGVGMVALALWLGRFDIARRVVKQPGLPRFMALCLLIGYVWMAMAGVMLCLLPPLASGTAYDAPLHAFFLGFVISMIFGHAPVIFPSIVNRPVSYSPRFYVHLALLHIGLLLRMHGDMALMLSPRIWGGIINAIAIALFLVNTVISLLPRQKPQPKGQGRFA